MLSHAIAIRKVGWFTLAAFVLGIALFSFNYWGQRHVPKLVPLAVVLNDKLWLSIFVVLLVGSAFIAFSSSLLCRFGAILIAAIALVATYMWVPSPIVDWPVSVLGEHTVPELAGEIWSFTIIPVPHVGYSTRADFDALDEWTFRELAARFWIVALGWTVGLAALWFVAQRQQRPNQPMKPTAP